MKSYKHYRFDDFVVDDDFRQWVQAGSPDSVPIWQNLLDEFPEKKVDFENAREFILSWEYQAAFSDSEAEQGIQRILASKRAPRKTVFRWLGNRWAGWQVAAAVVLLLGIGWGVWQIPPNNPDNSSANGPFPSQATAQLKEIANTLATPKRVDLPDGSQILLAPASQIQYSAQMTREPSRAVFLNGEALFTVTKNPQKPFMVYANGLVTKVVGTSFTVKAIDKVDQVTVVVHTGKVAVFPVKTLKAAQKSQQRITNMVLLTPNQQVIFNKTSDQLTRSLVKKPALVRQPENSRYFVFKNTPIARVFRKLEESYGVTISYDDKTLKECNLTVALSDEPLFEKLDIICQTIGATYEVWDTRIVISGKGCRLNTN